MTTFDATSRESCTVQRTRTNTPLQALAIMNDITYVESARALAQRMMLQGGQHPPQRIRYGFRLVLARTPREDEQRIMLSAFERFMGWFHGQNGTASKLVDVGESKWDRSLSVDELSAYAMVASLILNLDEAVTKQ